MAELTGASVPRRVERVVQAEVDGELVLMSPRDFAYFGTVGAGGAVWDLIDGQRSIAEIAELLEEQFAAEPGLIRVQTTEFIDALVATGIAELT